MLSDREGTRDSSLYFSRLNTPLTSALGEVACIIERVWSQTVRNSYEIVLDVASLQSSPVPPCRVKAAHKRYNSFSHFIILFHMRKVNTRTKGKDCLRRRAKNGNKWTGKVREEQEQHRVTDSRLWGTDFGHGWSQGFFQLQQDRRRGWICARAGWDRERQEQEQGSALERVRRREEDWHGEEERQEKEEEWEDLQSDWSSFFLFLSIEQLRIPIATVPISEEISCDQFWIVLVISPYKCPRTN